MKIVEKKILENIKQFHKVTDFRDKIKLIVLFKYEEIIEILAKKVLQELKNCPYLQPILYIV